MENERDGVLIFGEYSAGKRPICRNLFKGKEAYERYQLSGYIDEIINIKNNPEFVEYRNLFQQIYLLCSFIGGENLIEIGSTLFASIDKYKKCNQLYGKNSEINFIGIEPSDLLRNAAQLLHRDTKHTHYHCHTDIGELPSNSVGRSYQASSYAFNSTEELVEWISQFKASQDGIWFSPDGMTSTISAFGNELTLFSYPKFSNLMTEKGYFLNCLSMQKARHFESELFEVFILSHKICNCDAFNASVDEKFHIGHNENPTPDKAREIQPDRVIPQEKGSFFESLWFSGILDFTSMINAKKL